jgi:hypothetical protein
MIFKMKNVLYFNMVFFALSDFCPKHGESFICMEKLILKYQIFYHKKVNIKI